MHDRSSPMRALLRRPAPSLATDCQLTHMERQPIGFERALQQHAAYRDALESLGVETTVLPALDALPDSVFVEDTALVLDEGVVLCRPGADSRLPEIDAIAPALQTLRPDIARIEAPGTLDGGDVLRVGRLLLAGRSTRSNDDGLRQLADAVAPWGYTVRVIDVPGSLHFKTACTALDDRTLLLNPRWVDTAALHDFEQVHVVEGEEFAANVVRLPRGWVVNEAYPETAALLRGAAKARGVEIRSVDIGEFGKAEAGLTCMSLIFREGNSK